MKKLLWATLAVIGSLAAVGEQVVATPQSPPATPPAPAGDLPADANADDPVDSLLRHRRFDAAEALARQRMDAVELSTEEAAKWAVALSRVRLTMLLRGPLADQQRYLDSALEPLDRVLGAYPDHRRALWLRFQRSSVVFAVARRQGLVVLATPGDETRRLAVLAALIETTAALQQLESEVSEEIAAAFQRRERPAWIDELMALRDAIAVKRVELLLRRGELFTSGSDDYLAAAAEAQQAAVEALTQVRQDPVRRGELLRMRCEALLRSGSPDRAAELLRTLLPTQTAGEPLEDATLALAVRIAMELGQWQQAEQLLTAHYGERPAEAAAAPESDLARLQFLIATRERAGGDTPAHDQLIGDWIEAVRERGGDFAQRRAETIALQMLGGRRGAASDERLVLAEAAAKLRQNQPVAAAEMLDASARRSADSAVARRLAVAAAAAYRHGGRDLQAVRVLRDVAQRHADDPESADLHLQAAVLWDAVERAEVAEVAAANQPAEDRPAENPPVVSPSRSSQSAGATELQGGAGVNDLLQQTVRLWPQQQAGQQARRWLVKRLLAANQPLAAAMAGTPAENAAATDAQWEEATRLWIEALAVVPLLDSDFAVNPASEQLTLQALEQLTGDSPAAQRGRHQVIVLFGSLSQLASTAQQVDDEPWLAWLLRVRRGAEFGPPPQQTVAAVTRHAAMQRLMADGMQMPRKQTQLATAILQLSDDEPSLAKAQALLWSGRWQAADELLQRWIAAHPAQQRQAAALSAAQLLAQAAEPVAKENALQRYGAVAAQLTPGSRLWHQTKLATLELMTELGQTEASSQLAKYILLTRPPEDEATRASYRRWAEP